MARPTYAEALSIAQNDPLKLLAMLVSLQEPDGTEITEPGGGGAGGVTRVNDAAGTPTPVGYDVGSTQLPTNIPLLKRHQDEITSYEGLGLPFTVTKSIIAEGDAIAAPGAGFCLEILFFTTKQVGASSVNVSLKEADGASYTIVQEMIAQGSTDGWRGPWRLTANKALRIACSSTSAVRINGLYRVYTVPA